MHGRRDSPGGGRFGRVTDGAQRPAEQRKVLQRKLKFKEPLKPELCREYLRERFAEGFPEIVDTFMQRAAGGSVPHTKAMVSLGGLDEKPMPAERARGRGTRLIRQILDEMRAHRLACSVDDTHAAEEGAVGSQETGRVGASHTKAVETADGRSPVARGSRLKNDRTNSCERTGPAAGYTTGNEDRRRNE